jgi:hypothetical protein
MSLTITEIYEQTIKPLPAADRLRLATLILNDIPPQSVIDYSEEWSEEDMRDATLHSWRRAAASFGEGPDDADGW